MNTASPASILEANPVNVVLTTGHQLRPITTVAIATSFLRHRDLTPSQKLVGALLASYAYDDGFAEVSLHQLAVDLHLNVGTVQRAIRHLAALNLLVPWPSGSWPTFGGKSFRYQIGAYIGVNDRRRK